MADEMDAPGPTLEARRWAFGSHSLVSGGVVAFVTLIWLLTTPGRYF